MGAPDAPGGVGGGLAGTRRRLTGIGMPRRPAGTPAGARAAGGLRRGVTRDRRTDEAHDLHAGDADAALRRGHRGLGVRGGEHGPAAGPGGPAGAGARGGAGARRPARRPRRALRARHLQVAVGAVSARRGGAGPEPHERPPPHDRGAGGGVGRPRPVVLRARAGVAALRQHLRAAGRRHRQPLDGHRRPDGRGRLPPALGLRPGPRLAAGLRRPRAVLRAGRAPDRRGRRPGRAGGGERHRLRGGLRLPDGARPAVVQRPRGPRPARRGGAGRRRPRPGAADVDAGRPQHGALPEPRARAAAARAACPSARCGPSTTRGWRCRKRWPRGGSS